MRDDREVRCAHVIGQAAWQRQLFTDSKANGFDRLEAERPSGRNAFALIDLRDQDALRNPFPAGDLAGRLAGQGQGQIPRLLAGYDAA